jgi:adenosylcobyric acid synthase
MNPVLLKPESDVRVQVVVRGTVLSPADATPYQELKRGLMNVVLESFERLAAEADVVLVEGAGSPAEVNLRDDDIANMGFAEAADVPVVLVGDIDRGGVIAAFVGTWELLSPDERARVRGTIVNKFRGDVRLFDGGRRIIATRTGWADCGVVPYFPELRALPSEDAVDLRSERKPGAAIRIVVPAFPRIANFDDLDPLNAEPDVEVSMIEPGRALPGDADLVILPGTKATIADLRFLRATGWDVDLQAHLRRGGHVVGVCGGYQMLGRVIEDADGIEGPPDRVEGLGLLDVETRIGRAKVLTPVRGVEVSSGKAVLGYEMHLGETHGPDRARPWLRLEGGAEGATSRDGRVRGSYVHGLFAADEFRHAFLAGIRHRATSGLSYEVVVDGVLDAWAAHLEAHLDVDRLLTFAT